MSHDPGPEYYVPPTARQPVPPPPPSIGDGARTWALAKGGMWAGPGQRGLAIATFVLGVVAIITGWIPWWGIGLCAAVVVSGVLALVSGQSKGLAISGLVMGAFGGLMGVLTTALVMVGSHPATPAATLTDVQAGLVTVGEEPDAYGLSVAEQAFGVAQWDPSLTWYTVIVSNDSGVDYAASELTVQAIDAQGNVVDSSWTYSTLHQGKTAFTGMFYYLDGAAVDSISVVRPADRGPRTWDNTGTVSIGDLTSAAEDYWTTVTCTITSGMALDVQGPQIVVVARDASGAIIDAAVAYLDPLAPGATAPCEATFYESMPDGTTYEAYWTSF